MREWQKSCNLFTQKNHVTSLHKKSRNFSVKKNTQPPENKSCNLIEWVSEKSHATSLHTKITQSKSHATPPQKKHATSPQKITQPLHKKKSCIRSTKKSCNLQKNAQPLHKKIFKKSHNLFAIFFLQPLKKITTTPQKNHATSKKITQPLHKKITQSHHKKKLCNVSTHKNHITSPQKKNHSTTPQNNCATPQKNFFFFIKKKKGRKIIQPLNKEITQSVPKINIFFFKLCIL